MSLYFTLFETISLFVSAFIVNFLVLDGRTNYLEGALLCAAYIIIAYVSLFSPFYFPFFFLQPLFLVVYALLLSSFLESPFPRFSLFSLFTFRFCYPASDFFLLSRHIILLSFQSSFFISL